MRRSERPKTAILLHFQSLSGSTGLPEDHNQTGDNKLTFDPPTVYSNWPKVESGLPMFTPHLPWKFHANRSSRFLVMLLTKKQTKKQRKKERNRSKTLPRPPTGGGVILYTASTGFQCVGDFVQDRCLCVEVRRYICVPRGTVREAWSAKAFCVSAPLHCNSLCL